jgi:hypothetical protein
MSSDLRIVGCNMKVFFPLLQQPGMVTFLSWMLLRRLLPNSKLSKVTSELGNPNFNLKKIIVNIKLVLSFVDTIKEWRDLSVQEWNFRDILCGKLSSLLHQQ